MHHSEIENLFASSDPQTPPRQDTWTLSMPGAPMSSTTRRQTHHMSSGTMSDLCQRYQSMDRHPIAVQPTSDTLSTISTQLSQWTFPVYVNSQTSTPPTDHFMVSPALASTPGGLLAPWTPASPASPTSPCNSEAASPLPQVFRDLTPAFSRSESNLKRRWIEASPPIIFSSDLSSAFLEESPDHLSDLIRPRRSRRIEHEAADAAQLAHLRAARLDSGSDFFAHPRLSHAWDDEHPMSGLTVSFLETAARERNA